MFAKVKKYIAEHRHFIIAVATVVLTVAAMAAPDSQYVQAAIVVAGLVGIHVVNNAQPKA